MTLLALSRYVSFHARGDAAFAWHGLTGDVAEMSRDVLALLLSFDPPRDDAQEPPAGLSQDQAQEFTSILRSRRFLVQAGAGGARPDEMAPLLAGFPRVPRAAVFERTGEGVALYTRTGERIDLDPVAARLYLRCDGERSLGQVVGDAGPQAVPALLHLARAELAALKILSRPVSQGGIQLNPAAESTMPYPEIPDPRAYAAGGPAPAPSADDSHTFASLFSAPHRSLRGKTYAEALLAEVTRRHGAPPAKILSLGVTLPGADTNVAQIAQAEAYDAIVASEIGAQLGFSDGRNTGAIALVRDAADALRPGGVLIVADFGDPTADATPQRIRFADLQAQATRSGVGSRVLPLGEVLDLDGNEQALSTTRASFPAIRALFRAHGLDLPPRAWLRSEVEELARGKLDLGTVHGLQWAPLSERVLSLSPRQFWALVATKPGRTLH